MPPSPSPTVFSITSRFLSSNPPRFLLFLFPFLSSIYSFSPIHFLPLASLAPFPTLRRNLSELQLTSESRQSPAARRFLMQFLSKKSASGDNSCYIRINWISIIIGVSNVWGSKPECQRHISIKTPHREGKLRRGSFFNPYSPTPV